MLTLTFGVIANLFFGSVTKLGGFSPIAGIDRYTPGFVGDVVNDRQRLYYIALIVRVVRVRARSGISFGRRSASRSRASATSRCAWRLSGFTVPLHRMLAFGFGGLLAAVAGVLDAWWNGQISPSTSGSWRRSTCS